MFTSLAAGSFLHGLSDEHELSRSANAHRAVTGLALTIDFDNIPGLARASGCNIDAGAQPLKGHQCHDYVD
jgi:hypothetical protein